MPRLCTQTEFANAAKFSKQYVYKLVKKGIIPLHSGKIDAEEAVVILAARKDPSQPPQRKGTAVKAAAARKAKAAADAKDQKPKTTAKKTEAALDPSDELPDPHLAEVSGHGYDEAVESPMLIETRNLNIEHLKARVRSEQEKGNLAEMLRRKREGELVEVVDVRRAQIERAGEEREAFMQWPSRFGADIAAELGLEELAVVGVLAAYVRRHLEERSRRQ